MAQAFKACSIAECNGNAHRSARGRRGWCSQHYTRWRLNGDPNVSKYKTPRGAAANFYADIVLKFSGDDCLIWPFGRDRNGYGVMKLKGRMKTVSRIACEAINGEPGKADMQAAHNCNNGHLGCVNPRHLRWATRIENAADAIEAGVLATILTKDDVRKIRAMKVRYSQREMAEKFGVSEPCIGCVVRGETWRHVS